MLPCWRLAAPAAELAGGRRAHSRLTVLSGCDRFLADQPQTVWQHAGAAGRAAGLSRFRRRPGAASSARDGVAEQPRRTRALTRRTGAPLPPPPPPPPLAAAGLWPLEASPQRCSVWSSPPSWVRFRKLCVAPSCSRGRRAHACCCRAVGRWGCSRAVRCAAALLFLPSTEMHPPPRLAVHVLQHQENGRAQGADRADQRPGALPLPPLPPPAHALLPPPHHPAHAPVAPQVTHERPPACCKPTPPLHAHPRAS